MCAFRVALVLAFAGLALAASAQEYDIYNVSDSAENSLSCTSVCAPTGAVLVAWEEAPGEIWTRLLSGELQIAVHHGTGHAPAVCWRDGMFLLAYGDGAYLRLRQGDGTTWGTVQSIPGGGQPVIVPAITAAPATAAAEAYAVWQEGTDQVWYSQRVIGNWSAGELVIQAVPLASEVLPEVVPALSASTFVPRVYYYDGLAEIRYRERSGATWTTPVEVPGRSYANGMSIGVEPSWRHHIVSHSPQPSCPCNHLQYTHELPGGGWSLVERLDVLIDAYNWPQFTSLALSADNTPGIFFYQITHDEELQLSGYYMFYLTRDGGTWTDHSEILDGHVGMWTGLVRDPQDRPVFVWSEENGDARDIMLSRFVTSAGVPEPVADGPRLVAYPNPSPGALTFTLHGASLSSAQLELFDPAGRCVLQRAWPAGVASARWQARDERGARLPAGAYLARLASGGIQTTARVVLIN